MTSQHLNDCVIIGQGKAGDALLRSLKGASYRVSALVSRSEKNTKEGIAVFNSIGEWALAHPNHHPTFFIAWPDAQVPNAVDELYAHKVQPGAIVHLSGVCHNDLWMQHTHRCPVATFHPNAVLNKTFSIPSRTTVGIEASDEALKNELTRLAKELDLSVIALQNVDRRPYHLAAVHVANLACVLVNQGVSLWTQQGLDPRASQQALGQLLRTCAERIENTDPEKMLTGPIARGDIETVSKHVSFLDQNAQFAGLKESYQLLSTQLLELTEHSEETLQAMRQLLKSTPEK